MEELKKRADDAKKGADDAKKRADDAEKRADEAEKEFLAVCKRRLKESENRRSMMST
jgi:Alanine-zipper, major outer membrane lipoprotein